MKKRITSVVLVLCLLLPMLPITALAEDIVSGDCGANGANVTWSLDRDTGVLTISGTGDMENYQYPDAAPPWYQKGTLVSVVIGRGVTSIGDVAFSGCSKLKNVEISDSVTSIGKGAFINCSGLVSVKIPNSVTSIGKSAFKECTILTSVIIPNSVTSIGEDAFSRCGLTSVTIPNGVTSIGPRAFYACYGLTGNMDIPASVTSIGTGVFSGTNISSFQVAEDNSHYASQDGVLFTKNKTTLVAFPKRKTGTYNIPNSVTDIGGSAFEGCGDLTSVIIPDSVTSIGDRAFEDCSGLTSVTIPGSVESIGDSAFSWCIGLTSVIIPDSVTSIGDRAFEDCSGLTSVTIPDGMTSIASAMFYACSKLTNVTIPDGVTSIGNHAFNGCSGLDRITIPGSMESIGWWAFSRCSSLTDVYYDGSKKGWEEISISDQNGYFTNATIHYNFCTVTFDLNYTDATGAPEEKTVNHGDKVTKPADPTWSGYAFGGWYKDEECTEEKKWNFETAVTEDITLYAKWEKEETPPEETKYTVTFNSQGGSAVTSQTVTSGGKVAKPADPTREGYKLDGWYMEADCKNAWNFETDTVTEDTTLYAKWTKEDTPPAETKYTVTFNSQGGSAVSSQTVTNGGMVTKPADPTRSSYTFGGWYKETDCKNAWNFATDTVTKDTTLYAKWTKEDTPPAETKYTVTFNSQGGSAVSSQTVTSGGKVTKPADPTWSRHTFGGWYKEADCKNAWNFATDTVSADITLYAKWEEDNSGTITSPETYYRIYTDYYTTGGRVYTSHSSATEGTRVTIEVSPRSGYELEGLVVFNVNTGRELSLTRRYYDVYTFIMPDSPVGVAVSFFHQDIDNVSWYAPDIIPVSYNNAGNKTVKWYYSDGQIRHVTDGLIPYGTLLTRDMLISILYNMDPNSTGEPLFWATQQKVMPDIYPSGLWGTDKNISREQAAMILYNYSRHMGYNLSLSLDLTGCADYEEMRPIARTAMSWAQATGLFSRNLLNMISPKSTLTCEEVNALLSRFVSTVARTR